MTFAPLKLTRADDEVEVLLAPQAKRTPPRQGLG